MGMKMPPALAVVEGIAGAMRHSANANPYARPKVLLPKALTKSVATRSPSPVFSKPYKGNLDPGFLLSSTAQDVQLPTAASQTNAPLCWEVRGCLCYTVRVMVG